MTESTNYDIHLFMTRDLRWQTRITWTDARGIEQCFYGAAYETRANALEVVASLLSSGVRLQREARRVSADGYEEALSALYLAWSTDAWTPASQIDPVALDDLAKDDHVTMRANGDVALTSNGARFAFLFLYT